MNEYYINTKYKYKKHPKFNFKKFPKCNNGEQMLMF